MDFETTNQNPSEESGKETEKVKKKGNKGKKIAKSGLKKIVKQMCKNPRRIQFAAKQSAKIIKQLLKF